MSRLLAMVECRIEESMRQAYLAGLDARKAKASASGAHFWVFEHAGQPGRFIEFTEAGSEAVVRATTGTEPSQGLWREVKGA